MRKKTDRQIAKEMYLESNGTIALVEIAEKLDRPPGTVRGWKSKDNWDDYLDGASQPKMERSGKKTERSRPKRNAPKKVKPKAKPKITKEVLDQLEDADLTDMQRLFCLYYVKSFNATQSAIKAGYSPDSAHVQGSRLLNNDKIREEIRRLKDSMTSELFVDAMDVLNQYAKIAFADITEFVEFGQEEVEVMTAFGPLMEEDPDTGEKVPVTKVVNTVRFKDSALLDGQLISEVRQGRDGASIKLLDKMRALEKLEKYFDLIPDTWKRKIEEEKLALDRLKITGDGKGSDREAIDDFIKATTVPVDEVKDLFEDDEDEEN